MLIQHLQLTVLQQLFSQQTYKWHIHPHSDTHKHTSVHRLQDYNTLEQHGDSPLTEGVQAGQNFGVLVAVQTYAADQELLVNLADHGTGKSGAFTGHPKTLTWASLFLLPCTLRRQTEGRTRRVRKEHRRQNVRSNATATTPRRWEEICGS